MIRSSESGVDFGCSANPAMFSLFIRSRLSTARYIAEMRLEAVPCVPACHPIRSAHVTSRDDQPA
jgi:hypothetical protein